MKKRKIWIGLVCPTASGRTPLRPGKKLYEKNLMDASIWGGWGYPGAG